MPPEHLHEERLEAYRRQTLPPGELLAVDDHLAVCDACRGRLDPAARLDLMSGSIATALAADVDAGTEHVPYDQLAAYVDNTISDVDRELVTAHVEMCGACALELRDLQEFSTTIGTAAQGRSSSARQPTFAPSRLERARDWVRSAAAFSSPTLQGALAASVLILGAVVIWEQVRYRRLEQQSADLRASVEAVNRTNESLRAAAESLQARNQSLEERITAIDKGTAPDPTGGNDGPSLRDTAGTASLGVGGTVTLAQATLPPQVSESVREFLSTGDVSPVESALAQLTALRSDATRSALRRGEGSAPFPKPIGPALTGVRSATPSLRWKTIPSAQEYRVTVADENGNIVWQSSVGSQARLAVPARTLQRGRMYFWQVEATGNGESRLSPTVGFWVLDERMLREVEGIDQSFENSALVRASAYAARGLFEEALTQVERLAQLNPKSPQVQKMRTSLRRQLGQE